MWTVEKTRALRAEVSAGIKRTPENSINMDITTVLHDFGIHSSELLTFIVAAINLVLMALAAWGAYLLVTQVLGRVVAHIVRRTSFRWDNLIFDRTFFRRMGLLIAPIVVRVWLSYLDWENGEFLSRLVGVWIVLAAVLMVSAILDGLNRVYESFPVSKDKPIKVFIQVVMIFFWCAAFIVVVGIFTRESVATLLAGLTAFAAVLMLIFKDSILGFVAGVQLSANNMVRIGDWIVMPGCGADGNVLEINLTTVKVQNWDLTITTIPTYKLVSDSFTNWRGMEESQGRRIKRSVNIDVNSIHYLTDDEIEVLRHSVLLRDYMEQKLAEVARFNADRGNLLDERRLTNIGTFREYMESWLEQNPNINLDMTHMVRQLQPTPTGLPLEIYCFSARQAWVEYEGVQSDIFDHLYAVMDMFHLRAFQYSGNVVAGE